ncbi:unnamed protein product [Rotaria sordida]|uniref:Proteasome activator complex subunit 4 n=1 Tax=Rotaria sordida TaxID=392033 RepID=A0A819GS98_9BILA|nr:unnamed protein product [Rotaria sordida]
MGSYPLDKTGVVNAIELEIHDENLQKPNIYNKYLPFYESIKQHGFKLFSEIKENLSRTIQLAEFEPGFSFWSDKLERFIYLYEYYFTKSDHLKLIHFYLSILSINDLNYSNVKICFDMLNQLMRKTRLITRDDLTIDWRLFYKWTKLIFDNHDETHGLIILPKYSLMICIQRYSPYFSSTATQEILDQFRPQLCLTDWFVINTFKMFDLFLPVKLPPALHDQGFKLWLNEFFDIWENVYNGTIWELYMISMFSSVAWNNIGYIDWEPWLSKIFTRILRGFSLPIGKMQISSYSFRYMMSYVAKWIVAMLNNKNSCFEYLKDLFIAIKSFYHPSNTGNFQNELVEFIVKLAEYFVDRVHLEHKVNSLWFISLHESSRLTEQNITDFVNCIKEYAFISTFNKNHSNKAAEACQYLSMLRPELIVPTIVEKLFSSIDNMTEPHRFTSIMICLTRIARQIVRQTPTYSQGQTYVIPLLMAILPGIDLNDFEKTSVTLDFYNAIFKIIICVDCSSAIQTRNDLTEIEKEVCLSTEKFQDFIIKFLNRIFQMIEILSTDVSDDVIEITEDNIEDNTIELKLISIISSIVQQCSSKIFQIIREKITDFLSCAFLSSKVRKLVTGLVQAIVKCNPDETIKYLLPKIYDSIEKIMNTSESNVLLTDHKGDIELNWYLILFSELVRARGDTLLIYKQMIMSIFHQYISIINKNAYEAIANAANHLLKSLSHIYPIDYRLTLENIDESFNNFLPIRAWGQHVDFDKLQVQYHIPNIDEIDFACEFVETFIYSELTLLNEKSLKISNDERLRSLTIIYYISMGCLNMIPRIDSQNVQDLVSSVVSCDSKYPIYHNKSKFRENLRMRLVIDIGKLLDVLVDNHSDDVKSIKTALKIYSLSSIYYGISKNNIYKLSTDIQSSKKLFKNKLSDKRQNSRFLSIKRIVLQLKKFETNNSRTLTEIDKQIVLKLFNLSINRYSEVRQKAQFELFAILNHYHFSFQIIVDRIVELLNKPGETDHHQIKGCLYILLGNNLFFLPTKYSWTMMEKLWPSIALMNYAKKPSTQKLINDINKKIIRTFITDSFIQDINEISKHAAAALWHPLKRIETKIQNERNQVNIKSYNNLMETLNLLLKRDTLTWKQQKAIMSLLCLLLQKHIPISHSCIQTFVDFLIDDNMELRKCAEKGIAAFCRLQKPPRIYVEKSLEEILHNMDKSSSSTIDNNKSHSIDCNNNLRITIDSYRPPETQIEWEQTCFLDKSFYGYYTWPQMIKYSINKRTRYIQNTMPEDVTILYDRFIDKSFIIRFIQLIIFDEDNGEINFDKTRFAIFKGLFRNFGFVFIDNFIEQLYILIHEQIKEKQKGSHRVAAEIVAGMIRGSKYWTLEMLDELWKKLTPFLTEVFINLSIETRYYWFLCFKYSMENTDPRRMNRPIEFFRTLINNQTIVNTLNETSRWSLISSLRSFQWRIPSIWCSINEQAKVLLDHPSKSVRDYIVGVLSISFSFDITLFNGKLTYQPDVNQFIDDICERLREAIEVYDKKPLVNISDQIVEMEFETCKALNFMEAVVQMLTSFFFWSRQPMKNSLIRIFPYLCEMESIGANNHNLKDSLPISRMKIGMSYLHEQFLEGLIQQLEQVCMNPKWHARRAAIDFIQNMIFCNLFNARQYAKQLHTLVLKYLFDEQLEVRITASTTLSGFYQCGYIQVTDEDLQYFCMMSKTNYFTEIDGKKVTLMKNIVKRHGGNRCVLGLCAIILSSPYDISIHVPDALMLLCEHLYDPHVIQQSTQKCLSEFRRTHYDSWHEHQENFTEDQLLILTDVFISHSYYA